jgi:uncharacterized membrane protein YhfC
MTLNYGLILSFALAIAFEILFPLVVGFWIHRHYKVRWRFFLYGALVFFLSQLVTRVPIVQVIQSIYAQQLQASQTLLIVWYVILAVTAGLFEEIGRWLGYRYLIKNDRTWRVSLMYGAGHGGLESMVLIGGLALLGLINVIVLSTTDFSHMNLPAAQLAQIEQARQQLAGIAWWTPLLGAYERFVTIFFHIALSVLVLQVFVQGTRLWLLVAIALHAGVGLATLLLVRPFGAVATEAALTVLLPLSFGIIYYFRPRDSVAPSLTAPDPA